MSRSAVVLVGVAGLLLLTWITIWLRQDAIEADLVERVGQALSSRAVNTLEVTANGRDLVLRGEISSKTTPEYAASVAADVWGVRAVDVSEVSRQESMLDQQNPLRAHFDSSRITSLGGKPPRQLGAASCQRMMTRLASVSAIRFETGAASPMLASYPVLNDLAAVVYQCPGTRIVIGGHTDGGGDREFNLRLSEARAKAVEQFFAHAGIPSERMQIVAHGDSQPKASNATPEGRTANRRITFDVLDLQ